MNGTDFDAARRVLAEGVPSAFPAAVVEVGRHDHAVWCEAFGTLGSDADASSTTLDTIFDLASLTKVLATTTVAMAAVDGGRLGLHDPLSRWLESWRGDDRRDATIEDLLAHSSGLPAYLPFFRDHRERSEFERSISTLPLEYPSRTTSVYSDLGFILLGFILTDATCTTLDTEFDRHAKRHAWGELMFRPGAASRGRTASTEFDPWRGRQLVGEVHDENAWALAGVAGHAGLFGTAAAVGCFARTILQQFRSPTPIVADRRTFTRFITRSTVSNSSRALGWDTMLPTSSCGTRLSAAAIGHTGFTGTSLWIDPEADVYMVLLTNRVCPSRHNDTILEIRPRFHDAVMAALA